MLSRSFPGSSALQNLPRMQERHESWVQSLGEQDPMKEGMATHSSILFKPPHGQRGLVGYSPQGRKQLDMTEAT